MGRDIDSAGFRQILPSCEGRIRVLRRSVAVATLFSLTLLLAACSGGKLDSTPTYVDFTTINQAPTPTITPVAAATVAATTYAVQAGDTLSGIAARFGVSVDDLARANGIADNKRDQLQVGQVLVIPPRQSSQPVPTATPISPAATQIP
jgi:LysM repeat protein